MLFAICFYQRLRVELCPDMVDIEFCFLELGALETNIQDPRLPRGVQLKHIAEEDLRI